MNRASDERILLMLAARASGISSRDVAAALGVDSGNVRAPTNAVMKADLAESGEDPDMVRAAYWSQSTGSSKPRKKRK